MQQCGTHKTAPFYDAVFFLPKFHVKQIFCTLQSPFVGCFYFVGFQTFSTLQSPHNQKYLIF